MKCPECQGDIINVETTNEPNDSFIEIEVTCQGCEKEFFARIEGKDLILIE